jgi:hypothetical protein
VSGLPTQEVVELSQANRVASQDVVRIEQLLSLGRELSDGGDASNGRGRSLGGIRNDARRYSGSRQHAKECSSVHAEMVAR